MPSSASGAARETAAAFAVGFFGITFLPPVLIIGAGVWAAMSVLSDASPRSVIENKLRARVTTGTDDQLEAQREHIVEQIGRDVDDYLRAISSEFRSALTSQVMSLRQELNSALEARNEGEASVRARRLELGRRLTELQEIERALDEIVDKVVTLDRDAADVGQLSDLTPS